VGLNVKNDEKMAEDKPLMYLPSSPFYLDSNETKNESIDEMKPGIGSGDC